MRCPTLCLRGEAESERPGFPIPLTVISDSAAATCRETSKPAGTSPAGFVEIVIVSNPTSRANHTPEHVHRRGDYCPALFGESFVPTKPAAVFLWEYAEAQLHEETFTAFVAQHPDEFEGVTAADPVRAEIVLVTK